MAYINTFGEKKKHFPKICKNKPSLAQFSVHKKRQADPTWRYVWLQWLLPAGKQREKTITFRKGALHIL